MKRVKVFQVLPAILFFLLIFYLNHLTLYTADDFTYHFVYNSSMPAQNTEPINGFLSIIRSQRHHYFLWNGRFVAHSIVQFFMQYDKVIFNIFNSLILVFLVYLLMKIPSRLLGNKTNAFIFSLNCIYLWFFIPQFGQTVLWLSGSCNYLWTGVIYTSFILFNMRDKKTTLARAITAIFFGFISGATNENSGPAASLIVFLFIIMDSIGKGKVQIWKICGFLSSIAGFFLMAGSPGSSHRGTITHSLQSITQNAVSLAETSFHFYRVPYALLAVLLMILLLKKQIAKKDWMVILIFLLGHFASIYCLVLAPEAPLRVYFGPTIFIGLALSYLSQKLYDTSKKKQTGYLMLIPLIALLILSFIPVNHDLTKSYLEVKAQYKMLENGRGKEVTIPLLSQPVSSYNAYWGTNNVNEDPKAWFNQWMASYFEVSAVRGKK